jgi:hypothetical protein
MMVFSLHHVDDLGVVRQQECRVLLGCREVTKMDSALEIFPYYLFCTVL